MNVGKNQKNLKMQTRRMMWGRISFWAFGFLVLGGGTLWAARLQETRGRVEVQRAGAEAWILAQPKMTLAPGDTVKTNPGAQTRIKFKGGHQVAVREGSKMKIGALDKAETALRLLKGRLRAFVSRLRKRRFFRVRTPVAVASVRGTVFEMEVLEDQTSRLSVLDGTVSYKDLAGLGKEVQVLKGQSVVVQPGSAPSQPEPVPAEMLQGLVPEKRQDTVSFALRTEIQRETGLASFKEFFQVDAAREMKTAQYQESKVMIDAFGKRVRLEQYITRPASNIFSYVALNTREDRFDFTRFDLHAKSELPADLGQIDQLYSKTGHDSMDNWVTQTERLSSNGSDYYREWQDGGTPTNMTTNGVETQQVIFSNWYAEVRAGSNAPTLLSHWVPDPTFAAGDGTATTARDNTDALADGAQDIPSGYVDFESGSDAGATVGDTRGIDSAGFSNVDRLNYFSDPTVADSYRVSEGYSRTSETLFDGISFANATLNQSLGATQVSRHSTYSVPSGTDVTLRVDQYTILDDGTKLDFLKAATLGSNVDGVNNQSVFSSSLTSSRKIDIVISPSIFKKAGLLGN